MPLDPEIRKFAKLIAAHEKRLQQVESGNNTDQLPNTSNENGTIPSYDLDGNLRQILGRHPDGTFAVTYANGPQPLQPTAPVAGGRELAVVVYWNGKCLDADGNEVDPPADLDRIEVHVSEVDGFEPSTDTLGPTLRGEGVVSLPADLDAKYVKLVAISTSDVAGPPSVQVETAAFAASHIAAESITAGEIAAGAVTAAKLAAELVIASQMESPNYVSGESGWEISPDGSAEFNDLTARGTLESNYTDGFGDTYTLRREAGFYSAQDSGLVNGSTKIVLLTDMSPDPDFSQRYSIFDPNEPQDAWNGITVLTGNQDLFAGKAATVYPTYAGDSDGTPYMETWHSFVFINGYSDNNGQAAYRMMPDGTVMLKGIINTGAEGARMAEALPPEYRPASSMYFAATGSFSGSRTESAVRWAVYADGTMTYGHQDASSPPWISLNGIRYSVM